MDIENSFTVDAPIENAWVLLTNLAEIAPCLPGAKLTDETDGVYSGGIKIKVGPVTSEYKGSAEFVEKDDEAYRAVISGKGRDTRGAGNAQALITAQMTAVGDKTRVDILTDLKVSGKVAQFGRGVMQDVSTKLMGQFAECLESKIGEPQAIENIATAGAEAAPTVESIPDDDEVLDLLDVAGAAVFKRFIPVLVVAAIVIIAVILLIA
jgi:carbon monoxide dehydrogenase subunit G